MDGLKFVWDPHKAAANKAKHGVSFEEARSIFYDDHARLIADPDHSGDEDRFLLLGVSAHLRLVVVSHCYRKDSVIRIISARKAKDDERRQYEGFRHA